ncbi:hypothetical protein SAMN02745163_03277 [Clostridium cavendishii DSM 21758]|uniref:DUF2225 domain-containing protein n=1 Tax=Clostridium cavendishii DSM 21758 TaxID=1121302 RepID=A0A1M6Q3Q6_9CLOT|nr:DUF2225 domain-containing protein [Clostridium cavendishii]SHK14778.1 hypothetical protein SAMN02745163_03277 [Clostridium cavendishii DSM 21758]
MDKIFSGLENLGFNNVNDLKVFNDQEAEKVAAPIKKLQADSFLFDKEMKCPVCNLNFKTKSVKVNGPRVQSRDTDFFITYAVINPYFYDVWLCPHCGYAAMKADFPKIKSYQIEDIKNKISPKWKGKSYPEVYDENVAIERYKLALLNAVVMNAKDSTKSMICLKTAWMYRMLGDNTNECSFIEKSLEGFNRAYQNEDFPIYGLQRFSLLYLLGELNRRLDNDEEALIWFGKVLTTYGAPEKVKDMARDMRELIKEKSNI